MKTGREQSADGDQRAQPDRASGLEWGKSCHRLIEIEALLARIVERWNSERQSVAAVPSISFVWRKNFAPANREQKTKKGGLRPPLNQT